MNDEADKLVGTWRLVSCVMRDEATGERTPVWGEWPNGCLVITPDRRWIVIQTAEGRTAPNSDEDKASAFRSMLAYASHYQLDGDNIATRVDIAWDETWAGTTQLLHYKLDGMLHIEAAPQSYANLGSRVMRGIVVWRRE